MSEPTYTVRCISLYQRDEDLLDAQVAELKRRGMTRANRSLVIRLALAQLDLDDAMGEAAMPVRSAEQLALIAKMRDAQTKDVINAPHDAAEGAGA